MSKTSLLRSKKLWIGAAIPLLIIIYFFDNIKGQYRFMQYCKNEGGLRVYEPLEKGAGWLAEDETYARVASQLRGVEFVRFYDAKYQNLFDLRYIGKNPQQEESFEKYPADFSKSIRYVWKRENKKLADELRLFRTSYEIFSIDSNHLLVRYYSFSFSQFERSKTLLNAPSDVSCFNEKESNFSDSPRWLDSLNSSFENQKGI